MNGYYPATYGFDENISLRGLDIPFIDYESENNYSYITSEHYGQNLILSF
ncbi:unnamed protein product, partial [marine sediment metagenome]